MSLPPIPRSELSRLEGLGDNCELGFVLRRLGFETGMLFRWASIRPESLLATLRGDFECLYEFEELVPQNPKMVRDLHYGTSWHTEMRSALRDSALTFEASEPARRIIHATETAKLAYLVGKLRRKFEHPNPVFIIKANAGIPDDLLESIHYQVYRRAVSPFFSLLEVREDPARAGMLEVVDRNKLRGFVTRFAPYDRADEGDDASWLRILAQALAYGIGTPGRPDSASVPAAQEPAVLRFPAGAEPQLILGNEWCRLLDDAYRLHARGVGNDATALRWTGVHLVPNSRISITAGCPIADSKPVRASLVVNAEGGEQTSGWHVFGAVAEEEFSFPIPPSLGNPLTVKLIVEPVGPMRHGDRAVIDLQPIRVTLA